MRYKNKYRTQSTCLEGLDYSSPGLYYITICTKNMISWFGEIVDEKMVLNDIGKIVEKEWLRTEEIRKNIELDEWIIMPNHLHGIIWIKEKVETHRNASLPIDNYKNQFGPQRKNLASTIRGFKGSCTRQIRQIAPTFAWQPRYYDHIIRDESELENILHYIINNPLNWKKDHQWDDLNFIKRLSTPKKPRPLFMN